MDTRSGFPTSDSEPNLAGLFFLEKSVFCEVVPSSVASRPDLEKFLTLTFP